MSESTLTAVIIGSPNSVFVSRTAQKLREDGIKVEIVDPFGRSELAVGGYLAKIKRLIKRMTRTALLVRRLRPDSTALIMFLSIDLFWLAPLLKLRLQRVVGVAFGSDILRRVRSRDRWLRFGLRRLDAIAATNDNVMQVLRDDFPLVSRKETKIIRFGLPVFDELDDLIRRAVTPGDARRALGFDPDKKLISLGYAASPGQRQLELIQKFATRATGLPGFDFLVPVQYGSPEVVAAVKQACEHVNADLGEQRFHALVEFHDPATAALARRASDVLINHSISDAFSGTVQEVIYAGNLVLAARHLPYGSMPGFGTAIRSYSTLEDIFELLAPDALKEWKLLARDAEPENRASLHATSSWDAVLPEWRALIWGERLEA